MSLATYLVRRGKQGIWQLRVPIPRALHGPGKPKERVKSMGTTDRRIASDRALRVLDEWKSEWTALRGDRVLALVCPPQAAPGIGELALQVHDRILDRLEHERRQRPPSDAEQSAEIATREAEMRRLARRTLDGDLSQWEAMADRMIAGRSLPISRGSADYHELVRALSDASVEALSVFTRWHSGDLQAAARSPGLIEERRRQATKAKPGETLLDWFDRYAEQRQREGAKRAEVLQQDRKIIEQFATFIGRDRNVASVTAEDVRTYRNALRDLPARWQHHKDLQGLSMVKAAARARELGLLTLALTTVNKHLSTISPLYAWLIEDKYDIANPCVGLFHQRVKGKSPRPPFTTDQLNAILRSPLFVGFDRDGREHVAGTMQANDWRRWIPLVGLFSGARIGEIAQLRIGDVQDEGGLPFILVAHDNEAGLSTKSGQSRVMALHPKLIEIGFLTFRNRQLDRAGGNLTAPLFPELTRNPRGQFYGASRFWREYLRRIGIKGERDGLGTHSFRHLLADQLRQADYLDDEIEVALGHNQKTVTGGYGRVKQGTVRRLAGMIAKVEFKGVDFGHLL